MCFAEATGWYGSTHPVLQPATLTRSTHRAVEPKLAAFRTGRLLSWRKGWQRSGVLCSAPLTAQTHLPPSRQDSQTYDPISDTRHRVPASPPSSAVGFGFYCLPSYLF